MNIKTLKILQSLKLAKYRKLHNKFLVEGKRMVKTAFQDNQILEKVYCTKKFFIKNRDWIVFKNIDDSYIDIISENDLKKISNTVTPSGICAMCNIPKAKAIDTKPNKWVYLDNINNPGNLGTILRSASWFGLKHIAISPDSVDVYNPKSIRSAMGSQFNLKIYQNIELDEFKKTHTILSSSLNGENIDKFNFPKKFVLVFSNEAHGLSSKRKKIINYHVSIKKIGNGESLNVSTAASIALYIATR